MMLDEVRMRINIIRHSTTKRNEEGLATGPGLDVPLSPRGIKIIKDLKAQGIYPEEPGALYGSALSRTVETLNIIYPGREVTQRACLNERNHGILEFMEKEEYHKWLYEEGGYEGMSDKDLDWAPPGGESTRQVMERAKRCFPKLVDEFIEKGYDLVTICTHGAFIRDMFCAYNVPVLGEIRADAFLDNGKGVTLEVEKDGDDIRMEVVGAIGGDTVKDVLIDYMSRYKE